MWALKVLTGEPKNKEMTKGSSNRGTNAAKVNSPHAWGKEKNSLTKSGTQGPGKNRKKKIHKIRPPSSEIGRGRGSPALGRLRDGFHRKKKFYVRAAGVLRSGKGGGK